MGLFSFAAGLLGAGAQKKASKKGAAAMVEAMNRGIDTENAFNAQTRTDYMPYTLAGSDAIGQINQLTNGSMTADQLSAQIMQNPLYAARYNNGQEALLQNAAATGGLRGGNTRRGLADFGSDTLAQVYQQILGNLGSVANLGLGAQGQVTGVGQNTANAVTGLQTQQGQTRAQDYLARGGITAGMFNSAGGFLDSIMSSFLPGGGITAAGTQATNGAAKNLISSHPAIF